MGGGGPCFFPLGTGRLFVIFTTEELGELASSEEEGTRVAGKSPGRNQDTWGGAPGLHDPGKPFPISGPQFPRAPQGIWAGQRPETPRPSRQWPEQLSGFASQRAAATGQGSDPDCHGACRATPRRAGALTARRDARARGLGGKRVLGQILGSHQEGAKWGQSEGPTQAWNILRSGFLLKEERKVRLHIW